MMYVREAIAEYLAADPLGLPDGATFVESIRTLDEERRLLLEQRR